jgi:hypothetical protein
MLLMHARTSSRTWVSIELSDGWDVAFSEEPEKDYID